MIFPPGLLIMIYLPAIPLENKHYCRGNIHPILQKEILTIPTANMGLPTRRLIETWAIQTHNNGRPIFVRIE